MQKRIWRLRERKARVLSEDQEIGVELALWCKILQESSRRRLGQEVQEIQSKNTNPRTLFLCLDLGKNPNLM